MKISHSSPRKGRFIILGIIAIVVLAAIGVGAYALHQSSQSKMSSQEDSNDSNQQTDQPSPFTPPSDEEIQAGKEVKEQNVNPSSTPNPETGAQLTVTANNTGSSIQVRTAIAAIIQDGTCTIVLTKGSSNVTKPEVGIQPLSGYSTCKGWDIPLSELSSGVWSIKVLANYQSKTATGTGEVRIP